LNKRGSSSVFSSEIPWDWIEDRLRQPRAVSMWADLTDFAETARRAYRRDVWPSQSRYVECWLEKDALSGIFHNTPKFEVCQIFLPALALSEQIFSQVLRE
jgi:hypothetical protein